LIFTKKILQINRSELLTFSLIKKAVAIQYRAFRIESKKLNQFLQKRFLQKNQFFIEYFSYQRKLPLVIFTRSRYLKSQ